MTEVLWNKLRPLNGTDKVRDAADAAEKIVEELRKEADQTWPVLRLDKEKVYVVRVTVEEIE